MHGDVIYGASSNVHVYRRCSHGWVDFDSFRAINGWKTLAVMNHQLLCCSSWEHKLAVYSLGGQLLRIYGTPGRGAAGHLYQPIVCHDVTDDDSVLIADRGNNRLQLMSDQGEFLLLSLQPVALEPVAAAIFNNCCYVAKKNKTLTKYQLVKQKAGSFV